VAGGRLVLDTVSRGHLPPILWHADPATLVYAAPREALLASLPPGLDAPGTLFYLESRIRRDVSEEQRRVMLDAFRASGHEVRATGERVYRPNKSGRRRIAARVFLLEPTGSGGGAPEGVSPTP